MALRTCGAEVQLANSAAEAFALFNRWQPDLLVSDIGMPDEDGYALIRKIRTLSPEHGGRTPALALTAYARDEDREQALAAGFQRHLVKPVEVKALAEAVISLAGKSEVER